MSGNIIKQEQLEAEQSLLKIRAELEKLHRLSPHNLSKSNFNSIIRLLPTPQDVIAPPPQGTATALRWVKWFIVSVIFKIYWTIVYALASIGSVTVFIVFAIYLLSKLNWQTTYTGQGQGWQQHSDGYYYWGMPQDSYTTVQATVKTNIPEVEGREL
ncbi:hypothetical protein ABW19_dt0200512 [Dactylella cylindrospora]|nr:hypothetical protein ABW19_dt0200512 [Dactylella cylindrospora]